MMPSKTVIVTRHAGLVAWLKEKGITGEVIEHATPETINGENVFGALLMHLAALAKTVTTVDMPNLPQEKRGEDLTPTEMNEAGATLKTYIVREVKK
jgi:putative CRISPR-associated protein (TIGR02620 family)